jgi:hypothetical protein
LSKQTKISIASLLKDTSHPEPSKALENLERGSKPKPTKSVRCNNDLETDSEIDEELDLITIPFIDSDFYRRQCRKDPVRQLISVPTPNPVDAFTSNIGKERGLG